MIREGNIVFFKDDSLFAKTIRFVETGKCKQDVPNHVAIITMIVGDEVIITEAQVGGVRQINIEKYAKSKKWYARMTDPGDIPKGLQWLKEQVESNVSYDYGQIAGIWLRGFCRLLGSKIYDKSRKIRNFLNSRQSFICSELVERYAQKTGSRLWPSAEISQVTPYDLYKSKRIEFIAEREGI